MDWFAPAASSGSAAAAGGAFETRIEDAIAASRARGMRASELDLLQVGFPWEASRPGARVDELFADHEVELAGLARPDLDRSMPASLDPSLHTEGFGFVASAGAVVNDDRHVSFASSAQSTASNMSPAS